MHNRKIMTEEELKRIWQSSPNEEKIKFDKSRLMLDVQASVDQLHRAVKFRDMREIAGVILGAPVFAYYAYSKPHLTTKVAAVLIIIWGVFIIIKLLNARKQKPSPFSVTYMEYLDKTKSYLNVQKRLLESILTWYILPGLVLIMLFVAGSGSVEKITKTGIISTILAITLYYLNINAVKKHITPRLEKIDELIGVSEQG